MGKHRAVSPDFVSRQEAATRLMLSLRQVDRLLTKGMLPRTKVSANRTGIWRVAFDAYLASLPQPMIQEAVSAPVHEDVANIAPGAGSYSDNGYVAYCFETTDDCRQFALKADKIGLRGSISRNDTSTGRVILKWHRDLGFDVKYLESILTRWSFPFVRLAKE